MAGTSHAASVFFLSTLSLALFSIKRTERYSSHQCVCLISEFPLLDSQTIRVVHSDGSVYINLCAARETTQNSEGQTKGTTFTPDEWLHLTKRVDDIEAAVLRVAS